ncbi:non-canonical non-ribosomal peptide synthetase FUB8 [Rhypophila decipiens]|uniref:Non-canonical non-ribosomal peptide synthetase FUB8 n=1 Tax=Rhypophila decipiens TaxID=261697 RepID=A0AAN7B794_9PEZI|nr:non-canonical non-ribosomal peptide synthetase FUB8 [Rhypophila decipiens]
MPAITTNNTETGGFPSEGSQSDMAVILTGSTGSLGSYLLDSLARQQHVRKIYCLNRAEDGGLAKQKAASLDRGLDIALCGDDTRVEFLHVDLSQVYFGLDASKYRELMREATHIIHNQWPVNFNWDLSSFEPYIRGVRHLLDFCSDSPQQVEFLFISTIGTVGQVKLKGREQAVPERPNHELSPHLNGYCASKLICEMIIEEHVRSSPHRTAAICRVGQIAGPALKNCGMWNKHEWLPTIIASSKYMGLLPSSLGSMDVVNWVPVDYLSEIVLEMAGVVGQQQHRSSTPDKSLSREVTIYHAVNPHNVSWAELVPTVANELAIEPSNIVSWDQWFDALRLSASEQKRGGGRGVDEGGKTGAEKDDDDESNLKRNPGIKLLDFFGSLGGKSVSSPLLATESSAARSKTLASLQPVGTEWMSLWVKQMTL